MAARISHYRCRRKSRSPFAGNLWAWSALVRTRLVRSLTMSQWASASEQAMLSDLCSAAWHPCIASRTWADLSLEVGGHSRSREAQRCDTWSIEGLCRPSRSDSRRLAGTETTDRPSSLPSNRNRSAAASPPFRKHAFSCRCCVRCRQPGLLTTSRTQYGRRMMREQVKRSVRIIADWEV